MQTQNRLGAPILLVSYGLAVLVTLTAVGCSPTASDAIGPGTAEANSLVGTSLEQAPPAQPARAAVALFRIHAARPALLGEVDSTAVPVGEQSFRATQAALLKSPFVLEQALRTSKVAEIPAISGAEDSIGWLRDRIEVAFPGGGEVMEVRIADTELPSEQLEILTDAVCEAYIEQVIKAEWQERRQMTETLEAQFDRLREELAKKRDELAGRLKELARSDARRELLRIQYDDLLQERRLLARKAADAEIQFRLQLIDLDASPQPPTLARRVLRPQTEAAEAADPGVEGRDDGNGDIAARVPAALDGGGGNGENAESAEDRETPPAPWHRWHPAAKAYDRYQVTHEELEKQLNGLAEEAARLEKQLLEGSNPRSVLAPLQDEIRRYERLVNEIGEKLLRWEIELSAPGRVRIIQSAVAEAVDVGAGKPGNSGA